MAPALLGSAVLVGHQYLGQLETCKVAWNVPRATFALKERWPLFCVPMGRSEGLLVEPGKRTVVHASQALSALMEILPHTCVQVVFIATR